MKNLLLSLILLVGLISCGETQEKIYIITYNDGGNCEDYSVEIDFVSGDRESAMKRLLVLQEENILKDVKIYSWVKRGDFLYYKENYQNCSISLEQCKQENATFQLYIEKL
jgi:hypothetical protein